MSNRIQAYRIDVRRVFLQVFFPHRLATSTIRTAIFAVFVGLSLSGQGRAQTSRPNIIIIYADDHAQHAISAYGSEINVTPNIDQLAADGMRFTQSFVGNSICGPCRATLLTGLHAHAHGQIGNRSKFRDDLPTFAKTMQSEGYATAMIGKWHLSTRPNGFDYWAIKKGDYFNSGFETASGVQSTKGHVTDAITDLSLQWMEENVEGPFVLWMSHAAAHRTWAPPIRHLAKYADESIVEPNTLFDDYRGKSAGAASAQMRIARDLFPAYDLKLPVTGQGILDRAAERQLSRLTPAQREPWDRAFAPRNAKFAELQLDGDELVRWKYQRYIKNYLRSVAGLDDSVGRVREFLRDHDLERKTIVIYTSDQGFFLGEHGWYDKRWMYEESLRTPLIIRWPGVTKPGKTSDAMVQNIDMAPTLLQMAKMVVPDSMHGESLVPILQGEEPAWRDAIYYHYQMEEPPNRTSHLVAKHYGIRTPNHKLIYFYELGDWELYDLSVDPDEEDNRYDDPRFTSLVVQLKDQLHELRKKYEDTTGGHFR